MKKIVSFVSLLMLSICTNAQTEIVNGPKMRAENCINIAFTSQWYLNKAGVFNDGNYPEVISARNSPGWVAALEYERVIKSGLLFNIGFQAGQVKHNVDVTYKSLDFFDPSSKDLLSSFHNERNYKVNNGYIGIKFMMGYRWGIPKTLLKGWNLEGKVGFSFRASTTRYAEFTESNLSYFRDGTPIIRSFGSEAVSFGKKFKLSSFSWSHNGDIYVGLNKKVNWYFVKDIALGLSLTYGLGKEYRGLGDITATTYNIDYEVISSDEYRAQDFSIGFRVALGLWPK